MYSRSLFIRLDKLNIETINDASMMREYIESFICYIVKKTLVNEAYPDMDIRYEYTPTKIDNAFSIVEYLVVSPELESSIQALNNILTKNIEETIYEFHMSGCARTGSLNLNSMLINSDSLLITYEFFQN